MLVDLQVSHSAPFSTVDAAQNTTKTLALDHQYSIFSGTAKIYLFCYVFPPMTHTTL